MEDKFGNVIKVGDYVIYSRDVKGRHGKLFKGKVKEIKGNSVLVVDDDSGEDVYAFSDCFIRDNSDLLKTYADSDFFLCCLKSCGVDNWDGYGMAQDMYEGNEC